MGNEKIVLKSDVPKSELESLASCFLPSIRAFFETEEGKKMRRMENRARESKDE